MIPPIVFVRLEIPCFMPWVTYNIVHLMVRTVYIPRNVPRCNKANGVIHRAPWFYRMELRGIYHGVSRG